MKKYEILREVEVSNKWLDDVYEAQDHGTIEPRILILYTQYRDKENTMETSSWAEEIEQQEVERQNQGYRNRYQLDILPERQTYVNVLTGEVIGTFTENELEAHLELGGCR